MNKRFFLGCLLLALLAALAACGAETAAPMPLPSAATATVDVSAPSPTDTLGKAAADAASYILATVPAPVYGSVGGEWAVLALCRGGYGDAALFARYYDSLVAAVQAAEGVLHARKYTEYARVVLALTAIGKNPRDVGGYDLLSPLGDFDRVTAQGLNGAVFALLALDAGEYDVPDAPAGAVQATREAYLAEILAYAVPGGGFSLDADADTAEADITAMALCALAPYSTDATVAGVVRDAFLWLSDAQGAGGDYGSAESCAQVLLALATFGIDCADAHFVKDGKSPLDALLAYAAPGGGYRHTAEDDGANAMASEQALMALVAVCRAQAGESGLYAVTGRKVPPISLAASAKTND